MVIKMWPDRMTQASLIIWEKRRQNILQLIHAVKKKTWHDRKKPGRCIVVVICTANLTAAIKRDFY